MTDSDNYTNNKKFALALIDENENVTDYEELCMVFAPDPTQVELLTYHGIDVKDEISKILVSEFQQLIDNDMLQKNLAALMHRDQTTKLEDEIE